LSLRDMGAAYLGATARTARCPEHQRCRGRPQGTPPSIGCFSCRWVRGFWATGSAGTRSSGARPRAWAPMSEPSWCGCEGAARSSRPPASGTAQRSPILIVRSSGAPSHASGRVGHSGCPRAPLHWKTDNPCCNPYGGQSLRRTITMLSQDKMKSHRIRWAEAERELAIREFLLPAKAAQREYAVPPVPETADPSKVEPRSGP